MKKKNNTALSIIIAFIMLVCVVAFFSLYGYLWDNKENYEFGFGILSLLGWIAIGVLIVVWVCRLVYPKK